MRKQCAALLLGALLVCSVSPLANARRLKDTHEESGDGYRVSTSLTTSGNGSGSSYAGASTGSDGAPRRESFLTSASGDGDVNNHDDESYGGPRSTAALFGGPGGNTDQDGDDSGGPAGGLFGSWSGSSGDSDVRPRSIAGLFGNSEDDEDDTYSRSTVPVSSGVGFTVVGPSDSDDSPRSSQAAVRKEVRSQGYGPVSSSATTGIVSDPVSGTTVTSSGDGGEISEDAAIVGSTDDSDDSDDSDVDDDKDGEDDGTRRFVFPGRGSGSGSDGIVSDDAEEDGEETTTLGSVDVSDDSDVGGDDDRDEDDVIESGTRASGRVSGLVAGSRGPRIVNDESVLDEDDTDIVRSTDDSNDSDEVENTAETSGHGSVSRSSHIVNDQSTEEEEEEEEDEDDTTTPVRSSSVSDGSGIFSGWGWRSGSSGAAIDDSTHKIKTSSSGSATVRSSFPGSSGSVVRTERIVSSNDEANDEASDDGDED